MTARLYDYVGIALLDVGDTPAGAIMRVRADLESFLGLHLDDVEEPFTFVVVDSLLRLAPRRSEHLACAGRGPVEAAGEIRFELTAEGPVVPEMSNQSTGYCPESSSLTIVAEALDRLDVEHSSVVTHSIEFRLCESCGERNLVKDDYFVCGMCGADLPSTWNVDW